MKLPSSTGLDCVVEGPPTKVRVGASDQCRQADKNDCMPCTHLDIIFNSQRQQPAESVTSACLYLTTTSCTHCFLSRPSIYNSPVSTLCRKV